MSGVSGKVPKSAHVDFEKNLKGMWAKKLRRKKGVTRAAEHAANQAVRYYSVNQTKTTIQGYVNWIDGDIEGLKKTIDWAGLCGVKLKGPRCSLLRKLTSEIYAADLVAYGMTELLPSANGTLNVHFMDMLLRNAGREYLEVIPAIHDKYASLGLWQFTQFAVYSSGEVRGASEVNLYVGEKYKIPGSVLSLQGAHHHRAAFMFAVSNMKNLVQMMSDKEVDNLKKSGRNHLDEIVQFIAIAHHLPGPAIKGARKWAANNMKKELRVSLGPKLHRYATKTQGNLEALYKMIKVRT
jgi:hypothetical protein